MFSVVCTNLRAMSARIGRKNVPVCAHVLHHSQTGRHWLHTAAVHNRSAGNAAREPSTSTSIPLQTLPKLREKYTLTHPKAKYQQVSAIKRFQSTYTRAFSQRKRSGNSHSKSGSPRWFLLIGLSASTLVAGTAWAQGGTENDSATDEPPLPLYTFAQVAEHNTLEKGVWVTYGDYVYDVTEFIEQHPGGTQKIMLAAGKPIDPFWRLYQQHDTPFVKRMLLQYRIGMIHPDDRNRGHNIDESDPYAHDPERHPALVVNQAKPFNAETPAELLVDSLITPSELFYVRNHHPVPDLNADTFVMEIDGKSVQPTKLSVADLKAKYPKHTVVVTTQCAGNRRTQLSQHRETQGLPWSTGAISTAEWAGAKLRDVLADAGLDVNNADIQHVQFEAVDAPYGASIPVQKALDPHGDVIIAYEMNGADIPPDHGYPLRAVVPGVAGARQVKWVKRVITSDEEIETPWQVGPAYKGLPPGLKKFTSDLDVRGIPSIQELPVQSAICLPQPGHTVSEEEESITAKGFAISGGGRGIVRVDVSSDGGETWHTAKLQQIPEQQSRGYNKAWAWTLWEADIPLPNVSSTGKDSVDMHLIVKAVDTSYNNQPETPAPIWNLRGTLNNAWHRVPIIVTKEEDIDY
jgi:sulfite oxidase